MKHIFFIQKKGIVLGALIFIKAASNQHMLHGRWPFQKLKADPKISKNPVFILTASWSLQRHKAVCFQETVAPLNDITNALQMRNMFHYKYIDAK